MSSRWFTWISIALVAACGRVGFARLGVDGQLGDDGPFGIDGSQISARANRAFVTATAYTGNLGGVAGADAACQAEAASAGLPGTFVAVIRSSSRGPTDLLVGSRGWLDVAGTPIADQPGNWIAHSMLSPLHVDQHGATYGLAFVQYGSAAGADCNDWTNGSSASTGGITSTTEALGGVAPSTCDNLGRLYCAEIGMVYPVTMTASPGRLAFVTATPWIPGNGRSDADAKCASDATAAGLPGSYLALLATSTSNGFDRFSSGGLPWRRVDGAALTTTATAFLTATTIDFMNNFLNEGPTGIPVAPTEAWNGSSSNHCANWLSNNAGQLGATGSPYAILHAYFWQRASGVACNRTDLPVMCLQQ